MKPRRRARAVALQALYETDSVGHDPDVALAHRCEESDLDEAGETFARHLVHGVLARQAEIDQIIVRIAPEWPLDQIAVVDRNVLRIAVFEMMFDRGTPLKVAINEAVELAKLFGGDGSRRFVNGALGTLASTSPRPGQSASQVSSLKRE